MDSSIFSRIAATQQGSDISTGLAQYADTKYLGAEAATLAKQQFGKAKQVAMDQLNGLVDQQGIELGAIGLHMGYRAYKGVKSIRRANLEAQTEASDQTRRFGDPAADAQARTRAMFRNQSNPVTNVSQPEAVEPPPPSTRETITRARAAAAEAQSAVEQFHNEAFPQSSSYASSSVLDTNPIKADEPPMVTTSSQVNPDMLGHYGGLGKAGGKGWLSNRPGLRPDDIEDVADPAGDRVGQGGPSRGGLYSKVEARPRAQTQIETSMGARATLEASPISLPVREPTQPMTRGIEARPRAQTAPSLITEDPFAGQELKTIGGTEKGLPLDDTSNLHPSASGPAAVAEGADYSRFTRDAVNRGVVVPNPPSRPDALGERGAGAYINPAFEQPIPAPESKPEPGPGEEFKPLPEPEQQPDIQMGEIGEIGPSQVPENRVQPDAKVGGNPVSQTPESAPATTRAAAAATGEREEAPETIEPTDPDVDVPSGEGRMGRMGAYGAGAAVLGAASIAFGGGSEKQKLEEGGVLAGSLAVGALASKYGGELLGSVGGGLAGVAGSFIGDAPITKKLEGAGEQAGIFAATEGAEALIPGAGEVLMAATALGGLIYDLVEKHHETKQSAPSAPPPPPPPTVAFNSSPALDSASYRGFVGGLQQ